VHCISSGILVVGVRDTLKHRILEALRFSNLCVHVKMLHFIGIAEEILFKVVRVE
jgi:hypothetical protein